MASDSNFCSFARRSRNRQGTRFTRRGIDSQGNTANCVETEQILIFPNGKMTSYVQIRGSIPVLWSSPVHCKYDPKVNIDSSMSKSIEFATNHVKRTLDLYADYAGRSALSCINLIDNKPKKDQGKLGMAFKKVMDGVKSRLAPPQANKVYLVGLSCGDKEIGKVGKLIEVTFPVRGRVHRA